jgi:N-acetylglucosaminyldiphosphoundecaprenol N-acetyl-beta-D-mannosaminyltransferase
MVGVGSAFDLLAGLTAPAPEWMKRNGLQWLFRLGQEPRRLAWRYLYYNTRFILAAARQLSGEARHRSAG